MICVKNFFDQPAKGDMKTNDNIRKIATGQRDDNATGSFIDYPHFKYHYKMIVIDLSK